MMIIYLKIVLEFFPFIRKKFCIVFFLCVINFFQSQIFQANSSTLYISEGASIIDVYKENTDKIEVNLGKIFVSKNTLVCTEKNIISAQVVLIESHKKTSSTKKHLVFIPKLKKLDSGKIAESIKKSDFNFVSGKSNSIFQTDSANGYIAVSNTNSQIKAILEKNSALNFNKTVCKTPVNPFINNENNSKRSVNYFSIRPPPVVEFISSM